jgi:hypothetical protein
MMMVMMMMVMMMMMMTTHPPGALYPVELVHVILLHDAACRCDALALARSLRGCETFVRS